MDLNQNVTHANNGDLFCRPATWMDPVKFFLLNYILHAFTINLPPGTTTAGTIMCSIIALLIPLSGISWSLFPIISCPILEEDKVGRAMRSRALCMVVPLDFPGLSLAKQVHGQHPRLHRGPVNTRIHQILRRVKIALGGEKNEEPPSASKFKLIEVPYHFRVYQLKDMGDSKVDLACSHSFLKAFSAILQISYGSFELYTSRLMQFNKYGFAAYSLTVVPYILMSFVNLIASICRPTYPSVYQVLYKGPSEPTATSPDIHTAGDHQQNRTDNPIRSLATSVESEPSIQEWISQDDMWEIEENSTGAVGYAYGTPTVRAFDWHKVPKAVTRVGRESFAFFCCGIIVVALPYVIVYCLTGFKRQQSTVWQISWIMSNIALGQVLWILIWIINALLLCIHRNKQELARFPIGTPWGGFRLLIGGWNFPMGFFLLQNLFMISAAVPIIFSFVVVAQMMLEGEVCVRL